MTRALLLAVVITAGCTDLPGIASGECGNGVIDPTEDCDINDDTCKQCRLVCTTDADCASELAEYVCGADSICHAPSGVFQREATATFSFVVGKGSVADLDGDRIGDIVGFSDITLDVHFGDLAASFAQQSTEILPYSNANIALRGFTRRIDDGDEETPPIDISLSDILVPTPDGIVAYTSTASQTIVAYPFAAAPMGPLQTCATADLMGNPLHTFAIDEHHIAWLIRMHANGAASLGILNVATGHCERSTVCGLTLPAPGPTSGTLIDTYATTTSPALLTAMIAVGIPTAGMRQDICVVRYNEASVPASSSITTVTASPLAAFTVPFTFARVIPDLPTPMPCPALFTSRPLIGTLPDGIDYYAAAGTATTCTLAAGVKTPFDALTLPSGRIPLQPAIAGAGPDALAVISGSGFSAPTRLYAMSGTAATVMFQSPRPLYPIRSGDLDGDGSIEGIGKVLELIGGPEDQPIGEPDLDILYRTAAPIESFVPYRISTQSVPRHLAVGDFDGNNLFDIAYTERLGGDEHLMIAYGTRDRPLPPIEITKFRNVIALGRIDFRDSIDQMGGVLDDLIVADEVVENGAPLLTLLHGNPQRSMLAYFDPRPPGAGATGDQFFATIAGNFKGDAAIDIAAFHLNGGFVELFVAAGEAFSQRLEQQVAPINLPNIAGPLCSGDQFCTNGAEYLAWPIAGRDVIIGLEGMRAFEPEDATTRKLVTIDPMSGNVATAAGGPRIPNSAFVFGMSGGDIDGNTSRELIISYGGIGQLDTPDEVLRCDTDAAGLVTACTNLTSLIEFPALTWNCESAEVGVFTARGRHDPPRATPGDDLIALCKRPGGVGRVFYLAPDRDNAGRFRATTLLANAGAFEILAIGDVNGDRLTDLIGVAFSSFSNTPVLNIHLQCDAVDIACRNANAPVEVTP